MSNIRKASLPLLTAASYASACFLPLGWAVGGVAAAFIARRALLTTHSKARSASRQTNRDTRRNQALGFGMSGAR